MEKIRHGNLELSPEFRIQRGDALHVEVTFSATLTNFDPNKDVKLVFRKNNADYKPASDVFRGSPVVQKSEENQYGIQWILDTQALGEGAFEVQAMFGKEAIDAPKRFFVEQSAAQEIRRLADSMVSLSTSSGKSSRQRAADPDPTGTAATDDCPPNEIQKIALQPSSTVPTSDMLLWMMIWKTTENLSFRKFENYLQVLCGSPAIDAALNASRSPFTGGDGYYQLKAAVEAFVMVNCAVYDASTGQKMPISLSQIGSGSTAFLSNADFSALLPRFKNMEFAGTLNDLTKTFKTYVQEPQPGLGMHTLPYLAVITRRLGIKEKTVFDACLQRFDRADLEKLPWCYDLICEKLSYPCFLELIWSYWHEEGMLVQTVNAISRRFMNMRSPNGAPDPLAAFELTHLRPINNLMWGYIQDEQHRLSVRRRTYEYDHHYGYRLRGKAVDNLSPADSRAKFPAAFNALLHIVSKYFEQLNNTQIVADAFPVLTALKELHFIVSEGAHNQYGDLPSTARIEMLTQQYLISNPEFEKFLPSRASVALPETWMPRVATMSTLQGWNNPSILHFLNLARCGERILLSVRFGAWGEETSTEAAANWAKFWREEIQQYIHAYRAVTGVDLTAIPVAGRVNQELPAALLERQRASVR